MQKRHDLIRDELTRIHDECGRLIPREVWESQIDEDAPLHRFFTWNNDEAADLYRDEQARAMIRTVKVKVADNSPQSPAFVHVVRDDGPQYMKVEDAVKHPDLWEQVMSETYTKLSGIQSRLDGLLSVESDGRRTTKVKTVRRYIQNALDVMPEDRPEV